jgi:hypothetical protein
MPAERTSFGALADITVTTSYRTPSLVCGDSVCLLLQDLVRSTGGDSIGGHVPQLGVFATGMRFFESSNFFPPLNHIFCLGGGAGWRPQRGLTPRACCRASTSTGVCAPRMPFAAPLPKPNPEPRTLNPKPRGACWLLASCVPSRPRTSHARQPTAPPGASLWQHGSGTCAQGS